MGAWMKELLSLFLFFAILTGIGVFEEIKTWEQATVIKENPNAHS